MLAIHGVPQEGSAFLRVIYRTSAHVTPPEATFDPDDVALLPDLRAAMSNLSQRQRTWKSGMPFILRREERGPHRLGLRYANDATHQTCAKDQVLVVS